MVGVTETFVSPR